MGEGEDWSCGADRRREPRHEAVLRIVKLTSRRGEQLCRLRNLSSSGARLTTPFAYAPGEIVQLSLESGWCASGRIVWREGIGMGVAFEEAIDPLAVLAGDTSGAFPLRSPRVSVSAVANLRIGSHQRLTQTKDISVGGAKVELSESGWVGEEVTILIGGLPLLAGRVRWQKQGLAGIAFHAPLDFEMLTSWLAGQR